MRDGIKMAQAIMSAYVDGIVDSGRWDARTESAWTRLTPEQRANVTERVMTLEGVSMDSIRRAYTVPRRRAARATPVVMTGANPSGPVRTIGGPVNFSSKYSGWRKAIATHAEKEGYDEATAVAIMKQVQTESSGRLRISENHRYSLPFIRKNLSNFKSRSDAEILLIQKDPAVFFNIAYANRNGNGGQETGDGNRYRGRGPFQLTGRANYAAVGKLLGVDLISDPDWIVRTEANAVASVFAFLRMRGKLGAAMSAEQVAKLVNPGLRTV